MTITEYENKNKIKIDKYLKDESRVANPNKLVFDNKKDILNQLSPENVHEICINTFPRNVVQLSTFDRNNYERIIKKLNENSINTIEQFKRLIEEQRKCVDEVNKERLQKMLNSYKNKEEEEYRKWLTRGTTLSIIGYINQALLCTQGKKII